MLDDIEYNLGEKGGCRTSRVKSWVKSQKKLEKLTMAFNSGRVICVEAKTKMYNKLW